MTTTVAATSASIVLGPRHVHLDLLAEDGGAVEGLGGLRGRVLVVVRDKGVAFPGVVGVRHGSELLELRLELGVGDALVDAVDKELAALLSVGGHLVDPSGLSLSLKPNKSVDEGPGFPRTMITVQNDSCKRAKRWPPN